MATTDLTIDAGALTAAYTAPSRRAFLIIHVDHGAALPQTPPSSTVRDLAPGSELTIGRSRGATVMIDSEKISRLHARFRRDPQTDEISVADLGSRNGTRVNGERIDGSPGAAPHVLAAGDEITIGPATIVVGLAAATARHTKIADDDAFEARLAAELDHAIRYRHRVALAALRVTGNDAVIEAIARSIRIMDLAGDYGGDQYALLLPRLSRDETETALRRIVDEARSLGADIRAGIAIAPDDGHTPHELLERARAALRRARDPGSIVHAETMLPTAPTTPSDVVVIAPAMKRLYALIDRIAGSNMTVLVLGETGVGKELVAEAIHDKSTRKGKPLVKINCASIPETLLESELFGHERGSFTGADRRKIGFFEAAHGGTIFLDEIGEMQSALQPKLLRVLERKRITRVGGVDEIPVDVRVVAATHRDVEAEVRAGRFREDLYFRLAGFTLAVPPLRDRSDEIVPLALHFGKRVAAELGQPTPDLADDAQHALRAHDWPGNVRELRNAMERAIVVCAGGKIHADDLPDRVRDAGRRTAPRASGNTGKDQLRDQLADMERAALVEALELYKGNQTKTAQRLGISRRALIYKMEKYGLKPPPSRAD